jgi:Mg2+-importing ATPase
MNKTLELLLRQFKSPIILILIAATIVSIFVGDVTDGLIILAIIVPSVTLSFWQEFRANQTMEELLGRVQVKVNVVRNGVEISIPITQLVVGDLVDLRIGDIVPGDLKVMSSNGLLVDESVLTGESMAVEKSVGEELRFGTSVASGTAQATVVGVGEDTEYGALAKAVAEKAGDSGFARGLTKFGLLLMRWMSVLLVGLFIANMVLQKPLIDSFLFSIALAVGLTPQLLPAIISVSLSSGAKAMAKNNVLVKRLDAIEDFGSMDVLCTDKTGTITQGVVQLDDCVDISGKSSDRVRRLALINASLQEGFENPLDEAIKKSVAAKGIHGVRRISELPYDFSRKRLTVLVSDGEEQYSVTKGAYSNVLDVCELSVAERSKVEKIFEDYSARGFRVLAVATGPSLEERNLKLEGFLLFMDPLKPGAKEAVAELGALGIDLYLVTGDNQFVATTIGRQVGLNVDRVVTGVDVANLDDDQLLKLMKDSRVYAGLDPLQKQRVVKLLGVSGHTVGYFGDGINDAAALHSADVGISVDTAVDIAKHASAIVLLNKDLSVIAEGVRLGRRTFINTMKYARVGVSASFGNMLSMAVASIFLPFLPLLPSQILLLNFMTDFPALAISGDSVDAEAIAKPRRWNVKSIRNFMLIFGLISSVFDIATFAVLRLGFNADAELFRSGWFVESTLTELAVMLILRTRRRFWKSAPGKALWISSLVLALTVFVIPFTPVGLLLHLEPLTWPLVLALFGLIAVYAAVNEFVKNRWVKELL